MSLNVTCLPGAIPEFLERGFGFVKEGFRFADFISFFIINPMKMKKFGISESKLFRFHGIFKNGGRERGFPVNPMNPLWIHHWFTYALSAFSVFGQ